MRTTPTFALLMVAGLSHAAVNVTKTERVDLGASTGELGWGASGLAFGYSAGCGLNFTTGTISPNFLKHLSSQPLNLSKSLSLSFPLTRIDERPPNSSRPPPLSPGQWPVVWFPYSCCGARC